MPDTEKTDPPKPIVLPDVAVEPHPTGHLDIPSLDSIPVKIDDSDEEQDEEDEDK